MKLITKYISTLISLTMCFSFSSCTNAEQYSLSITGSELLYEDLKDSYKAGEEVNVKVKITPHEYTIAYLDLIPLTKTKSSQDNFYTFTFKMPNKSAVLCIENKKGFEDLLTGFYLTFSKDGTPIEHLNKELKSPDAVAVYYYEYYDENLGINVITENKGADVFVDGKVSLTNEFEKLELVDNLYFTYELLDAVAYLDWVYFNNETKEVSCKQSAGHQLNDIGYSSTYNIQSLSTTLYDEKYEEYIVSFESKIKINFKYIDYLVGVKVLEYDKNNQLLKASDFIGKDRVETFTVSETCEYAVIEEEYMVMSNKEHKGEKHFERTLINKTTIGEGKTLKYPRGDGLISPIYLSIQWAK